MRNATSPVFFFDREKVLLRIKNILQKNFKFFVTTFENGEELCIRVCLDFSFFVVVFHGKSATRNNDWTELSDFLLMPNQL